MGHKTARAWNPHPMNHHTNPNLISSRFLERKNKCMSCLNNFYFRAFHYSVSQLCLVPTTKTLKELNSQTSWRGSTECYGHPISNSMNTDVQFSASHFLSLFLSFTLSLLCNFLKKCQISQIQAAPHRTGPGFAKSLFSPSLYHHIYSLL